MRKAWIALGMALLGACSADPAPDPVSNSENSGDIAEILDADNLETAAENRAPEDVAEHLGATNGM